MIYEITYSFLINLELIILLTKLYKQGLCNDPFQKMKQFNNFPIAISQNKSKTNNFPIVSSSVYIPPSSSSISIPSSCLHSSSYFPSLNASSSINANMTDNKSTISKKISTQTRMGKSVTVVAPQSIHYIQGQAKYDREVSIILDLLSQFNSLIQLKQQQKSTQICHKLAKQLNKIDTKHRSYNKIKSLVTGAILLALIHDVEPNSTPDNYGDRFKRIQVFIDQQQNISEQIGTKQYLTKTKLLKILILYLQQKHAQNSHTTAQNTKQIKQLYKQFSLTQFPPNPSTPYFNPNFWQDYRILQLLVYQYIIIVQKLAQFDERKAMFLYKRGFYLAKRLLGKEHKFVTMVRKIREIGRQTRKLLKIPQWQYNEEEGESDSDSQNKKKNKNKHKSLAYRRLANIANPQTQSKKSQTLQKHKQDRIKRYTDKTDKSINILQQQQKKLSTRRKTNNVNSNNRSSVQKQKSTDSRNKLKTQPTNQKQRRTPRNIISHSGKQLDDNMEIWIAKKTGNKQSANNIRQKNQQSQLKDLNSDNKLLEAKKNDVSSLNQDQNETKQKKEEEKQFSCQLI